MTAVRGEEKTTTDEKIATLESQLKMEKELVETARVQGLDRDLRSRKEQDDRERLQKQLDDSLVATSTAETLREEVTPLGLSIHIFVHMYPYTPFLICPLEHVLFLTYNVCV